MNNKILLVIAIVAGLGATFFVKQHIDEMKGDTITVYKATKTKGVGDILGGDLEAITLPAGLFPDALEEAPDQNFLDYMRTTRLRAKVAIGDILLFRHFDSSIDPGVLPSIPAGKKAISVGVDQKTSVSYFIQPGDLVDVLGTFPSLDPGATSAGDLPRIEASTRPILQAVEVLAVGSEYRASERHNMEPYGSVTLLVDSEEAAKLIFAQDYYDANITLLLRSKDDTDIASRMPEVGVRSGNFDSIGNRPSHNVIIKKSEAKN